MRAAFTAFFPASFSLLFCPEDFQDFSRSFCASSTLLIIDLSTGPEPPMEDIMFDGFLIIVHAFASLVMIPSPPVAFLSSHTAHTVHDSMPFLALITQEILDVRSSYSALLFFGTFEVVNLSTRSNDGFRSAREPAFSVPFFENISSFTCVLNFVENSDRSDTETFQDLSCLSIPFRSFALKYRPSSTPFFDFRKASASRTIASIAVLRDLLFVISTFAEGIIDLLASESSTTFCERTLQTSAGLPDTLFPRMSFRSISQRSIAVAMSFTRFDMIFGLSHSTLNARTIP